jgi:hypothetical protein
MNRRSLGALAIVIIILMVIVATAGLDNLPRDVRNQIASAKNAFTSDRAKLDQDREFVTRAVQDDPALFRTKAVPYNERMQKDAACVASAATAVAALEQLVKVNRRSGVDKAREELTRLDSYKSCTSDAASVRAEAERWINYKRQLPARLQTMQSSYESLHAFDVDAAAPNVARAINDWPSKKDDLQARMDRLKSEKAEGERIWDGTAKLRAAAGSGNPGEGFDYANFFSNGDRVDQISRDLTSETSSLNALASQLYVAWDKLLLDYDKGHNPPGQVRIVKTKFKDATMTGGETTSEEHWENVAVRAKHPDESVGMVFERKPAGKYDSEAEQVVEPPAYARVAPPGQSNAYGSWQNGVWQWLPQYLILSHLLNMNRGPIYTGDYYAYDQARRRGEIFYGRNNEFRWGHSPRTVPGGSGWGGRLRDWASGSGGSSTYSGNSGGGYYRERPKTYGGSGYGGSQYQSRGGYSGSRYQSRGGGFGSFSSRGGSFGGGRSFGRGGRR